MTQKRVFLCAFVLVFCFVSCGNGEDEKPSPPPPVTEPEIFTVTFEWESDQPPPAAIPVKEGTAAGDLFPTDIPQRPTENGVEWTFAGWYDYATLYDKNTPVTKNVNLKAKFSFQNTGNPLIRHVFTADPAALVVGDTVYLYAGHDEKYDQATEFVMKEWLCFSSHDMITWVDHGAILNRNEFSWNRRQPQFSELQTCDAWAAHMVEKNGRFYFYVTQTLPTASTGTSYSRGIGVAAGPSPVGPFSDALGEPLVNGMEEETANWGGHGKDIDPCVWINERTGQAYLVWGNPGRDEPYCYAAELKPGMTEIERPIQRISMPYYTEGPWLYEHGDYIYLVYPSHNHQVGGSERLSYSYLPKDEDPITGNWTWGGQIANPAQNSFTIHPSVIELNGQSYFIYHNATLTLNVNGRNWGPDIGRRSVCLDYMYYNPDGTIKTIIQTTQSVTVPPQN
jgi:hypothetical protein